MRTLAILPLAMLAASCTTSAFEGMFGSAPVAAVAAPAPTLNPAPPPPPPATARTVTEFDTTSAEDRAGAVAVSAAGAETALGRTLATLGAPTEPGIWLKTPLVTALNKGRVTYKGRTINIELRPSGGAAGSGSQISLAAMRLLEAPLTGILDLQVAAIGG